METEENKNTQLGGETESEGKQEDNFSSGEESPGSDKLKFIAFFVVAFLVGVVIKTQAAGFFEVGYDDPKLDNWKSDFNLEEPKEEASAADQGQQPTENEAETQDAIDAGGSCGG